MLPAGFHPMRQSPGACIGTILFMCGSVSKDPLRRMMRTVGIVRLFTLVYNPDGVIQQTGKGCLSCVFSS